MDRRFIIIEYEPKIGLYNDRGIIHLKIYTKEEVEKMLAETRWFCYGQWFTFEDAMQSYKENIKESFEDFYKFFKPFPSKCFECYEITSKDSLYYRFDLSSFEIYRDSNIFD